MEHEGAYQVGVQNKNNGIRYTGAILCFQIRT